MGSTLTWHRSPMDSPMPTTLFPTLTLLAHQLSPTPCPLLPILTQPLMSITQVFMVIPTLAFTAMDFPLLPLLKKRLKDARSVRLTPRLTLRPMLLLMPDMDTDTDGANRQKQITS